MPATPASNQPIATPLPDPARGNAYALHTAAAQSQQSNSAEAAKALSGDAVRRQADRVQEMVDRIGYFLNWDAGSGDYIAEVFEQRRDLISQVVDRVREQEKVDLRQVFIRKLRHNRGFVNCLAYLSEARHPHDPHVAVGRALIPLGTREESLERILRQTPKAQRRKLEELYNKAFFGIGKTDKDTLREHMRDDLVLLNRLESWEYQKCLKLLDRDLTDADEIYFASLNIVGTHDDTVLEILERCWNDGLAKFHQLQIDWVEKIQPEYGVRQSLYEALSSELSGADWRVVKAYFEAYRRSLNIQNLKSNYFSDEDAEDAALRKDLQTRIDAELQVAIIEAEGDNHFWQGRYFEGSKQGARGRVERAVTRSRKQDQALIAAAKARGDSSDVAALEKARAEHASQAERSVGKIGYAEWTDTRAVQGRVQNDLTLADEIFFAAHKKTPDWEKVVERASEAWRLGPEAVRELKRDAARVKPYRNSFVPEAVIPEGEAKYCKRYTTMLVPYPFEVVGARRLEIELDGYRWDTTSQDMKRVTAFLRPLSQPQRNAVIHQFLEIRDRLPKAGETISEGAAFVRCLRDARRSRSLLGVNLYSETRFEFSNARLDIEDLVLGNVETPEDLLARGQEREQAAHTGFFSGAADRLTGLSDFLTGDDTSGVVDESMARLRFIVKQAKAGPEDLKTLMELTGSATIQDLARLASDDLRYALKAMMDVQAAMAELAGMVVDIAFRSLLVAVLGPTGIGGLAAAWISLGAGMALREGLRGAEYDLVSKENFSNLAGELITSIYDASPAEKILKGVLSPARMLSISKTLKLKMAPAMAEKWSASLAEYANSGFSKAAEKLGQNLIEQKPVMPNLGELQFRAGSLLAVATIKGASRGYTKGGTPLDSSFNLWTRAYINTVLNGPPNGQALGSIMAKKIREMSLSPGWAHMSFTDIVAGLGKGLLTTALSATTVTPALQRGNIADMAKVREFLKNPDAVRKFVLGDPALSKAYKDHVEKSGNQGHADPAAWLVEQIGLREKSYIDPVATEAKPAEPAVWPPPPAAPLYQRGKKWVDDTVRNLSTPAPAPVRVSEHATRGISAEIKRPAAEAAAAAAAPKKAAAAAEKQREAAASAEKKRLAYEAWAARNPEKAAAKQRRDNQRARERQSDAVDAALRKSAKDTLAAIKDANKASGRLKAKPDATPDSSGQEAAAAHDTGTVVEMEADHEAD